MQLMILENMLNIVLGVPKKNIQTAINGMQAYQKAISGTFNLIIMDLNMPVMDGFTAAKKIKEFFSIKTN